MITKEEFVKYISSYQEFDKAVQRLEKSFFGKNIYSIFESDWCEAVGRMLDVFLDSHFTDNGIDWITYYLWENVDDKAAYIKQDSNLFDKEKEIRYPLDTIDELWDFLLTDKKLYFKNV